MNKKSKNMKKRQKNAVYSKEKSEISEDRKNAGKRTTNKECQKEILIEEEEKERSSSLKSNELEIFHMEFHNSSSEISKPQFSLFQTELQKHRKDAHKFRKLRISRESTRVEKEREKEEIKKATEESLSPPTPPPKKAKGKSKIKEEDREKMGIKWKHTSLKLKENLNKSTPNLGRGSKNPKYCGYSSTTITNKKITLTDTPNAGIRNAQAIPEGEEEGANEREREGGDNSPHSKIQSPNTPPSPSNLHVSPDLSRRRRIPQSSTSNNNKPSQCREGFAPLYKLWPARNRFFCKGRFLMGPRTDLKHFLFTWLLIFSLSVVYFVLAAPFVYLNVSKFLVYLAIYLFLMTVIFLFLTSSTDPGIIPRKHVFLLFGDVPPKYNARILQTLNHIALHIPLNKTEKDKEDEREMKDKQKNIYKFCPTCQIFRPPRSSHCPDCDNCVEVFDHHCPYTNNCIGKRNYKYFVGFLISLILFGVLLVAGFALLLFGQSQTAQNESDRTILKNQGVVIAIIIIIAIPSILILFLIGALCIYHMVLACKGETTKENLTKKNLNMMEKHCKERMHICKKEPPLINYREIVDVSLFYKLKAEAEKPRGNENEEHCKIDSSLIEQIESIDKQNENSSSSNESNNGENKYQRYNISPSDFNIEFKIKRTFQKVTPNNNIIHNQE